MAKLLSQIVKQNLGHLGRMLGGSKVGYMESHRGNKVYFNANIYVIDGDKAVKVWYGDIDLTLDKPAIQKIANESGLSIFVTPEHPFRFQEPTPQDLKKYFEIVVEFRPTK